MNETKPTLMLHKEDGSALVLRQEQSRWIGERQLLPEEWGNAVVGSGLMKGA